MLTFPEVLTHEGIVIYPDDEDPNLFYALPGKPRLRYEAEVPVFRGLFWTDQASGNGDSVAGLRGAQLHFDVNLAIPVATQERIEEQLRASGVQERRRQAQLREERERLERMARARGENPNNVSPHVPPIGPIRFGSVQFLSGKVTLLEEVGGDWVKWSSAGGSPSLIADNNAAFALRLGPEGAAVWYRALQEDATALGIRYEMAFQARLPSLQIHVWAGSFQHLDMERTAERVWYGGGDCSSGVERINVDSITEILHQEGLVNVEIIKGSAQISDEHVSQLRTMAIDLISARVKEIIQNRIRGMTEEERRTSVVKVIEEEVTAFAELRLTQRDVIEWHANPQATITDFLGGLTGAERSHLVTLVDLSDPVVRTLEVPVSVGADWNGDPKITHVNVEVEYPAAMDEADRIKGLAFDANTQPQTLRWRRARGDNGTVKYKAIAYVEGSAEPVRLPGGTTNGPVHLEVSGLGKFTVKLRPDTNMFTTTGSGKVTGVELAYAYKQLGEPDHISGNLMLRADDADNGRELTHKTYRTIDQPLKIQPVYLREASPPLAGTERNVWLTAQGEAPVDIATPWPDKLRINAQVRAGIPGLDKVNVIVQYRNEATGFESEERMAIDAEAEWEATAKLVQDDQNNQRFRYRYSVEGADQLVLGPWVETAGDQLLILPVLAVTLRPKLLNLGTDYDAALVRLTYRDPDHDYIATHEFYLSDDKETTWLVPRVNPNLDSYTYTMKLFPVTGPEVDVKEQPGQGENLILRLPG